MPSSVIQAMRYEPVRRMLEIVFRGGRGVYRYFDVPMEEWRRFCGSPSKGTYLNETFKARGFCYEKVGLRWTNSSHGVRRDNAQSDIIRHSGQKADFSASPRNNNSKGELIVENRRERTGCEEVLEWGEPDVRPESAAQDNGAR